MYASATLNKMDENRLLPCTLLILIEVCLCVCVLGFSAVECDRQKGFMLAKMAALEEQAYGLAGHQFSLTSTEDIAQVITVTKTGQEAVSVRLTDSHPVLVKMTSYCGVIYACIGDPL